MEQRDAIEACRRRVLRERIDMHITRIARPVGPLLFGVAQEAAVTAAIKVQDAAARNLRTEIAVAGHLHVHDISLRQRDSCTIRLVVTRRVVAADINRPLFSLSLRQCHHGGEHQKCCLFHSLWSYYLLTALDINALRRYTYLTT